MSFNKKTNDIFKEIQIVFEDISKNTGWEPKKLPKDIKIEFGEAPKYFESFGVIRSKRKIVFGSWIDKVEPKVVRNHFWEFLVIRECFSLFFDDNLLFGELSQLTNFILNFLALSYLQLKDPHSSQDIKFVPIHGRFLLTKEDIDEFEREIHFKISSLYDIVRQGSSYK